MANARSVATARQSQPCTSGQIFGEMALLDDGPRDASVVTTAATDLLVLGRSDLEHVLKIAPGLRTELERQIAHRRKDPGDFLA